MSWTNGQIFDLIENYRRNPILWNLKRHSNYNSILVDETFKSISEIMGRDISEMKSKWRKLRITFQSIVRERTRRLENGSTDEIPRITWRFFDSMKFLLSTPNSIENLSLTDSDNVLDFYEIDDTCDIDVKQNVNDFLQPNLTPNLIEVSTNGSAASDEFFTESVPKAKRKKSVNKGILASSSTAPSTTVSLNTVNDEGGEDDITNNNNNNNSSNNNDSNNTNGNQNLLNICQNISKSFTAFCEVQKMNRTLPSYTENQAFGLYVASSLNAFDNKVASELRCTIANIVETRKRDLNL